MFPPHAKGLHSEFVPKLRATSYPDAVFGLVPEPPSAQSPFAHAECYPARRSVWRFVSGHYPAFVALTDSCARPKSSVQLRDVPSHGRSLQVAVSPCWKRALPDVISASLFLDAETHTTVARGGAFTRFFPPRRRPSPRDNGSALPRHSAQQLQSGKAFRGCSQFVMFRPPGLLATPVAPTVVAVATRRPWRLRSSRTCVVTFASIEYASRPNRVTDGRGLSPHKPRGLVGRSYPGAFSGLVIRYFVVQEYRKTRPVGITKNEA